LCYHAEASRSAVHRVVLTEKWEGVEHWLWCL
jgi:hypothetical protein